MSDDKTSRRISGSSFARAGLSLHSLLVEKSGKILVEAYSEPWGRDSLYRMYSVTKSVVSLAIGKLVGQGKLRLSDHITSFFPEMLPDAVPPELSSLTIENMLMMETCHSFTTYKQGVDTRYIPSWKDNWVWTFFNTPPDHSPGMVFKYDTSSTHVLASLVERLSGTDFVSFVRENITPLDERTYITKDPEGRPCGGSGLMMTPRDLLRLARSVMESDDLYVRKAVSRLTETSVALTGEDLDLECGYGYQFWRLSHNAYCMYGMGGQFAVMVPDKDITAVTTANTMGTAQGERKLLGLLWELIDELDGPRELTIEPLTASGAPVTLSGKRTYAFPANQTGISFIRFDFTGRSILLRAHGAGFLFQYGYAERERIPFPVDCIDYAYSSAAMLPDGSFSLVSELIGQELGIIRLKAHFSGDEVTIQSECYGEVRFRAFNGIASGRLVT